MKTKLCLLLGLVLGASALAQTVTVSSELTAQQKAALKYLQAQAELGMYDANSPWYEKFWVTNVNVATFATNYATLSLADVAGEALRARRNAISAQLASAPDDVLTAIESVLKWSPTTDFSKATLTLVKGNLALLPTANNDALTVVQFVKAWTNSLSAAKLQAATNCVEAIQRATSTKINNATAALQ